MKVLDGFKQKDPEWWKCRRGRPTGSSFDRIITPAKGQASSQQDGYIDELLAELFDSQYGREPDDARFVSPAMQFGIDAEPGARAWFAFEYDVEVREVGFCLSSCERFGCSPDGLIGDDGVLELKCPMLKTHIGYLRNGGLPIDYKTQVHGHLAVSGRAYAKFVSYSPVPQLPSLVVTVFPDSFTEAVRKEVIAFCDKLDFTKEKLGIKPTQCNIATINPRNDDAPI